MEVIVRLRAMGYLVRAEGDQIRCSWRGPGKPDPATVRPLLAELARHKGEALAILRGEADRPPSYTVASPDPFRPGWFVARRPGSPLEGRGPDEFTAVMALWSHEEALEREQREARP